MKVKNKYAYAVDNNNITVFGCNSIEQISHKPHLRNTIIVSKVGTPRGMTHVGVNYAKQ